MKKLKSLLCALTALGVAQSASAWTAVVNVDDPTHVTCVNTDTNETVDLKQGANIIESESMWSETFIFRTIEPWAFESVMCDGYNYVNPGDVSWYAYIDADEEYTITTFNPADVEMATFTVNVDDATKILFSRYSDNKQLELVNGVNTIEFNPITEKFYTIEKVWGSKDIYSVKKNDVAVQDNYGRYSIAVADGDVVDIQTAWPEGEATITFTYSPGGKGCISDVRVDNEMITDFDGESLKVKLGSNLSFNKANNWSITSYSVNGVSDTYFYSYTGLVKGDMEFHFVAEYNDPTITFNVNVDNGAAIKCSYYDYSTYSTVVLPLQDGDNALKIDRGTYLTFSPVAPYAIKEIMNLDTDSPVELYSSEWNITANQNVNNYKITTYNTDEARTATATFNIDDASKVMIRRYTDNYSFELKDGANTIKFNPETETRVQINSMTSAPLWEVKLNGEAVPSSSGYYYIDLTDGCIVDITATIPDIDIAVTLDITDEDAAANLITGVKVEGKDVELNGNTVAMKAGQNISLYFNNLYKIDSFMLGEQSQYVYSTSYTSSAIMADTKITIVAHKLGTIKATVKVNDPAGVKVGNGYSFYSDPTVFDLQAGDNEVEIPENNTSICWQEVDGYDLVSVKLNDVEQLGGYSTSVTVKEGDVLEFSVNKINYDKTAIVWIDDLTAANYQFNLQGDRYGDSRTLNVEAGYNLIDFRDEMLPLALSIQGTSFVGKVYINGAEIEGNYGMKNSFELPIKQDDVVKIFVTNEPVESKLSFDVEEGLNVSATTDRIVKVEDLTKEHTVFNGTEVLLSVDGEDDVIVKNGEEELAPNEEGNYLVTVDGDTPLSVKKVVKGNLTITLSATELSLKVGETAELGANIECDDDVTVEKKERTSSDEAVATIDDKGTVTGVAPGKAIITITVTDNYGREFSASCEVIVGELSGIVEVGNGQLTVDGEIYDLQGRRVNKAGKGLYIVNGKKVRN